MTIFRTQLFSPSDMPNVEAVQAGYTIQPLSSFIDATAPAPSPEVDWPAPTAGTFGTDFPKFLSFLLQFAPDAALPPEEQAMRQRIASIGIAAGADFDALTLAADRQAALAAAIKAATATVAQTAESCGHDGQRLADRRRGGQPRFLRWRLGPEGGGREARHLREQLGRGDVSVHPRGRERRAARRRPARLHADLPRGDAAAGQCLLVGDDVRRHHAASDRQSDQPLSHQLADAAGPDEEPRRVADDLHPA